MHYRETTSLPCNVAVLEFDNFENNLYFCVVKYGRTVKKRSGARLKTESEIRKARETLRRLFEP